jgi:hypothetical protein
LWDQHWTQSRKKNSALTFRTLDALEGNSDLHIARDAKSKVWRNVSRRTFCVIRTRPIRIKARDAK